MKYLKGDIRDVKSGLFPAGERRANSTESAKARLKYGPSPGGTIFLAEIFSKSFWFIALPDCP
jgi:hypothetical protein